LLLLAVAAGAFGCNESSGIGPGGGGPDASGSGDGDQLRLDAGASGDLDAGGGALDASSNDATAALDAAGPDGAASDGAAPDAAAIDGGAGDSGTACDLMTPPAADRERVVLVGHPFGPATGSDGHDVRSLTLTPAGMLQDNGMRLDIGAKPARIEFVPSGTFALVVGESGQIVSVHAEQVRGLAIAGQAMLPSSGYGDLRIAPDGRTAWVVGFNSTADSGISTVRIACDGSLQVDSAVFFPTRLSQSLVFVPGTSRAILLGGDATFAPADPNELRLLELLPSGGFMLIQAFDIWHDAVEAGRIAISPDGRTLLVPNGSPFSMEGGQVSVLDVDASVGVLSERHRLMNFADAREALFSVDGTTALVSQEEPNQIAILADRGMGFVRVGTLTGIGLPDQMAMVARGALAGRVLAAAVDPSTTPNLTSIHLGVAGQAMNVGQFSLGPGNQDIPGPVAIAP
jgi:hypothetical protein